MEGFSLLPTFRDCFYCGSANPHGLKIRYAANPATGAIRGSVAPPAHHCGFPGVLHGGLQGALLDDVMWWAASFANGGSSVTVEQKTRFLAAAKLPGEFTLWAQPLGGEGRKFRAAGWIEDESGKRVCEGEALYLLHSRAYFEELILPEMDFSGCGKDVRGIYLR